MEVSSRELDTKVVISKEKLTGVLNIRLSLQMVLRHETAGEHIADTDEETVQGLSPMKQEQ